MVAKWQRLPIKSLENFLSLKNYHWSNMEITRPVLGSSVLVTPRKRQCKSSITKPLMRSDGLCKHRMQTPSTHNLKLMHMQ